MGQPTTYQKDLANEFLKIILAKPFARLFWRRSIRKAYLMAVAFDTWFPKE
jgi:hypothetical protein